MRSRAFSSSMRQSALVVLLIAATRLAARGEDLDSVMYRDPATPVPKIVKTYPAGMAKLWLAALERPERELRTSAAQAIASAHERGMPGLTSAIGPLTHLVEEENQHPAVLVAAARTLVVLDARDAAPALLKLARTGNPELREIVEPALARWDHASARDLWIERLNQPPPHTRAVISAARWLGTVREERAAPRLRELALSDNFDGPVRLAAARALAEIRTTGLTADAAGLTGDTTPRGMTARLVAASLLRRHDGDEVVKLLQGLARDTEPAVAGTALARLSEIDSRHILPVLKPVLESPDAAVRGFGVQTLFRHPSAENIRTLSGRLSDPHPDVRIRARHSLVELASNWRSDVIDGGIRELAASDWRGQEQAAILLASLGHKPASARLVELLRSNRPEVLIAVGWALRQLAVPETLPTILEHTRTRHSEMLRSGPTAGLRGVSARALDLHMSHLIQLMGQARYEPASPVLRAIVPRFVRQGMPPAFTPVGPEARAAAIWSLGLIHEGKPEDGLVALIEPRLTGDPGMGPDAPPVRRMAAISLARMKAKQSLDALREQSAGKEPDADVVVNACRWAVGQLTGEPVPPAGVIEVLQKDWFLVPLP
jgi:HEAT repeat protein